MFYKGDSFKTSSRKDIRSYFKNSIMLNYTTDIMDNPHFSKWTPLTGVYIATNTLVCALAIIGDLVEGLWGKQYWIPSGYTYLNSISLTILGAATKLSMDLSTTMPRHIDQLAKLGTSTFMCIALASVHPSLGKLENSELLSNIVDLSIFVISSIVSLCIQLRTGVIYTFKTSHVILLTMQSLLLFHCILSAALLPYFKCIYKKNYQEQDQSARKEWIDVEDNKHLRTEKLKHYLKRFSMLAHSRCPHFLLGRTLQGTLPTIYGLVVAIVFFVTQITSITHRDKFLASTLGSSLSAYSWSVLWISATQTIAFGLGTIMLCIRGCYIAMVHLKGQGSPRWKVKLEKFWMRSDGMAVIRHYSFDFIDYSQHKSFVCKFIMIPYSSLRFIFLIFLVGISLMVFYIIEIFWKYIMLVCLFTKRTCITCKLPHSASVSTRPKDLASEEEEISRQYNAPSPMAESEGSVNWIMKSILYVTQKYLSTKERNTEHLEELLRQYLSPDFRGVVSFDSEEVAPLDNPPGSPPNCWSLPVVTLKNIAIALPIVDGRSIDKLIKGVNEGLVYVKQIEDKFNNHTHLNTVRYAAYGCLYETTKPGFQNKSPVEILESIATSAKDDFHKIVDTEPEEKVIAHCKYRLCETLLMEHRNDSERIFEKLCTTIADILGACLTNLKQYILTECSNSSSIEKRIEAASFILKFYGNTEKIMEIVEARDVPNISLEKMVFIDEWQNYYQQQRRSA